MSPELDSWAGTVSAGRLTCRLPLRADAEAREIVDAALALLFPHFAPDRRAEPGVVRGEIDRLEGWVRCFLAGLGVDNAPAVRSFSESLPDIQRDLELDAEATCAADPAAASVDEVVLAYPGFHALACSGSRTGSSNSGSRCSRGW